MKSITIKDIIKQLAERFNLPESEIVLILKTSQDYMISKIRECDRYTMKFNNCQVPGLGKFSVLPGKLKWLETHNAEVYGYKDDVGKDVEEMATDVSNTEAHSSRDRDENTGWGVDQLGDVPA